MNSLLAGFQHFLAGFVLITRPGLRRFVVIPLAVNMLLFIALFMFMRHYVGDLNSWIEPLLPRWLRWLDWIIWLLFFGGFFLVFIYAFAMLANLIAAPFNGLLAEKVEWILTGNRLAERPMTETIRDMPRMLGRQLVIIGYYLPRAVGILILFFIPVVNTAAAFLWFAFNGWFMAMQYLDYPSDNHRVSVRALRDWMSQHRWLALGFGLGVLAALMVPVLNFFVIPAAVAGATRLWLEEGRLKALQESGKKF